MQIANERVEIPLASGGSMGGYLAHPTEAGPRPAVLVFMEIFGVNAHIREVTDRVAREGYVALAPDYFHRTGPGVEYDYDDEGMAKGFALLNQLKADEVVSDVQAAIDCLRGRPDVQGDQIGCMGFCIGGHVTYLAACETDVKAAASFYGGGIAAPRGLGGAGSSIGRTGRIKGRILCLFGENDDYIPAEQVQAIREALEKSGTNHDIVVYPGAQHGFFCDRRDSYQVKAATDAWERLKTLFSQELGG